MNLGNLPAGITNWAQLPASARPGESGVAMVRMHQVGDVRLRLVAYSTNYVADHWCHKGHVVFVLAGELLIEHRRGPWYTLTPGISYHVGEGDEPPHRARSEKGATVFIVD
jgi:hypothetical protein